MRTVVPNQGLPIRVAALLFLTLCAAIGAPDWYRKQSTWHDSLLASLEAISRSELEDGFASFESGVMRGGQPARKVSVNVAGAREMHLLVTGCPDVRWGVADWADAALITKRGERQSLSQSNRFRIRLGRCEVDLTLRAGLYQKMRLGDRQFERGLNVQANSALVVPLGPDDVWFEAWIGVDAWAGTNGSVRFSVVGARSAAREQLIELLARDFPEGSPREEMAWEREDSVYAFDWKPGNWGALAERYAQACQRTPPVAEEARRLAAAARTRADAEKVRQLYHQSRRFDRALIEARDFDWEGLEAALRDLRESYPDKYPGAYLEQLLELRRELRAALAAEPSASLAGLERVARLSGALEALKREALLANPLLDFGSLLVLKRQPIGEPRRSQWEGYGLGEYLGLPRQSSWNYGTMPNVDQWTNEIAVLSPVRPDGRLSTVFKPEGSPLVADVELHWDAGKVLFSMPDQRKNWQVCEIRADGGGFRQLTPGIHPDVHNYNPIYLPSGEIIFLSTAPLQGVPCNASVIVGMMYKMGANGERIRQLTFEQDHDYTPSILNDGRVLYLRWDYTDTPHIWNRVLMAMNPDGTGQMEYYGANSYWPNSLFFARAIPKHPTRVVGIVTGHHEGRVGELFILDPARGRHETSGVVQRIPRRGPPVEAKIEDKLTEHSWPKFLHPWPLSDKYFLVACKPEPDSLWGIYLVDVFDNRVLLKEEEGFALLEPRPLAKRPKPPVIQDRVEPGNREAVVYMEDVYGSPGLRGVPRGTIKQMRLFTYQFGFQTLAGIDHRVGADGPWEGKRVLGTVPVEADGSALFVVPAKMPLSFQPLDAEGKAVALMRSWMTAMPGERVSCVGCHDRQSSAPPSTARRNALLRPASRITPWRGPARGFSFIHEVQPVLDKYCVGCHHGQPRPDGREIPDLRRDQGGYVVYRGGELDGVFMRGRTKQELLGKFGAVFEPSYVVLRKYVRVGGLESDLHLLPPKEFHADTSELVQMLQKGHHNVKLDGEAWDRLVTWIDLNAPCHGRWSDVTKIPGNQCQRRLELRELYEGLVEDWERMPEFDADYDLPEPVLPEPMPEPKAETMRAEHWPLTAEAARARQTECGQASRVVELGGGLKMEFIRVPAGQFIMGDSQGETDERPVARVWIEKPFWMAKCEVSNEQFRRFNPAHDSRFEHRSSWIFSEEYLGWPLNRPRQPVVRVSWEEAMAFCHWLGAKLGEKVTLPSEAQWEYACRAGSATPLSYGDLDTDFSRSANLGDINLRRLASEGWRPKSPDLVPRDDRFDDQALVTAEIGGYQPNAWGLHDMHGNAAEWTRSAYRSYPWRADNRDDADSVGKKVVRGGSWRDRPKFCRSGSRLAYPAYQKVYNVGFRVVIEPYER
jgi:formylglycine-generating enzyme required for sulfatase activity